VEEGQGDLHHPAVAVHVVGHTFLVNEFFILYLFQKIMRLQCSLSKNS
jgi:hypothetical protein